MEETLNIEEQEVHEEVPTLVKTIEKQKDKEIEIVSPENAIIEQQTEIISEAVEREEIKSIDTETQIEMEPAEVLSKYLVLSHSRECAAAKKSNLIHCTGVVNVATEPAVSFEEKIWEEIERKKEEGGIDTEIPTAPTTFQKR